MLLWWDSACLIFSCGISFAETYQLLAISFYFTFDNLLKSENLTPLEQGLSGTWICIRWSVNIEGWCVQLWGLGAWSCKWKKQLKFKLGINVKITFGMGMWYFSRYIATLIPCSVISRLCGFLLSFFRYIIKNEMNSGIQKICLHCSHLKIWRCFYMSKIMNAIASLDIIKDLYNSWIIGAVTFEISLFDRFPTSLFSSANFGEKKTLL